MHLMKQNGLRLRFSLRTLVLMVLAVGGICLSIPAIIHAIKIWQFRSFWERNLSTLEEKDLEKFLDLMHYHFADRMGTRKTHVEFLRNSPSAIIRVPTDERLILICEPTAVVIPGDCIIDLYVLENQPSLLSRSSFSVGWRTGFGSATWIQPVGMQFGCIHVTTGAYISGADLENQYYVLLGNTPYLARLADSQGKPIRNNFRYPNHTVGPDMTAVRVDQLKAWLLSNQESEILVALTWLAGTHRIGVSGIDQGLPSESLESDKAIKNIRMLMKDADVVDRIHSLKKGNQMWIREAAMGALQTLEEMKTLEPAEKTP